MAIRLCIGNYLSHPQGPDAIPFKVSYKGDVWANTVRIKNLIVNDAKATFLNGLAASGGITADILTTGTLKAQEIKDANSGYVLTRVGYLAAGATPPTVHNVTVAVTDTAGKPLKESFGYGGVTTTVRFIVTITPARAVETVVKIDPGYVKIGDNGEEPIT